MFSIATLSERTLEGADHPYIQVGSSLQAVKDIAEFYLEQLDIPVVGITGSVGKTSTKEVIASVLKEQYRTLKTQGNFNNELGLPLTVFRLRDEDEIAVLEMGISDFGEMTRLAKIAKPDTCVITNIGTCHLENLGDRDGVLKAKTEIFQYVKKNIVLNGDDDKLSTVKEYNGMQPVFFGNGENASVTCENVESRGLKGMSCDICLKGKMAENGELQTFHVQTEDAGVKSSHPHFKFKKGNDMNDTMTKGNAAALLPIGVFLLIFLGAGIAFGDFYAMPAVVAFLIALFVAFMQNRQQKFADKIKVIAKGVGEENIITMSLIFLCAGGFSGAVTAAGGVESTVNLGLSLIPTHFAVAGLFVIGCFISVSMGTSMGMLVMILLVNFVASNDPLAPIQRSQQSRHRDAI